MPDLEDPGDPAVKVGAGADAFVGRQVEGKLRFVLPTRLGEVKLVGDIDESLVRDVLEGR